MRTKIAQALATAAGTPKGLCGALLTPAEYALYFVGEPPFVLPPNPGPDLPALGFPAPTSAQSQQHDREVKTYLILKADWNKYNEALASFKVKFLSELDPATLAMMEDPLFGTMSITILEIRQRLIAAFGVMSPIERRLLLKSALSVYNGEDMRAWQNARNLFFAELAETGEPFSVETRLRWLIDSCIGHFKYDIDIWEGKYPTTAMQILNADELHAILITAYVKSKNTSDQLTADSRHTMNAITTEADINHRIRAGIAEGIAAAVATKGGNGICETCKAKVNEKNPKNGFLYRWCTTCFNKSREERNAKNKGRRTS